MGLTRPVAVLSFYIPANVLLLLGDLTASFSFLEHELRMVVGALIATDQGTGTIVTAELPFKNLRALGISLYKHKHGEDEDFVRLQELTKRAAAVEEKRNQITHSLWVTDVTTRNVLRMKSTAKEKHGYRFQSEAIDDQTLMTVVSEMRAIALALQAFHVSTIESSKLANTIGLQWKKE